MERSYIKWLGRLRRRMELFPDMHFVLRHDVDYDFGSAWNMIELDLDCGINPVVFLDIHNPNYNMDDIKDLYSTFEKQGVSFGLHLNVAYDNEGMSACVAAARADIKKIRDEGIQIRSVAAHHYPIDIFGKPLPDNQDIEDQIDVEAKMAVPDTEMCFHSRHFVGKKEEVFKLTDGGGIIAMEPGRWIDTMSPVSECFLNAHPIHNHGGRFTKKLHNEGYGLEDDAISQAHLELEREGRLTPYLTMPIENLPWMMFARQWINDIITAEPRKMFRVYDYGCGFGLLGAYVLRHHNVKYIAADISKEGKDAGDIFFSKLGYAPMVLCDDFFVSAPPEADVLAFLAYEDHPSADYDEILHVFEMREISNIIITTANQDYVRQHSDLGKWYAYIDQSRFIGKMDHIGYNLHILESGPKRHTYWFKRKEA